MTCLWKAVSNEWRQKIVVLGACFYKALIHFVMCLLQMFWIHSKQWLNHGNAQTWRYCIYLTPILFLNFLLVFLHMLGVDFCCNVVVPCSKMLLTFVHCWSQGFAKHEKQFAKLIIFFNNKVLLFLILYSLSQELWCSLKGLCQALNLLEKCQWSSVMPSLLFSNFKNSQILESMSSCILCTSDKENTHFY